MSSGIPCHGYAWWGGPKVRLVAAAIIRRRRSGHGTEKTVRVGRALFRPSRRKSVFPVDPTPLFFGKPPLIPPDEALRSDF